MSPDNLKCLPARIRVTGLLVPEGKSFALTAARAAKTVAIITVLGFAAPALAVDSGGDPMPWEGPMDRFLTFFTGPFVRIAAIIAIVLLGVGMAFSENGTGMRRMVTAFFGIALAFGAATWGLTFFGFSGGATVDGAIRQSPNGIVETPTPSPTSPADGVDVVEQAVDPTPAAAE